MADNVLRAPKYRRVVGSREAAITTDGALTVGGALTASSTLAVTGLITATGGMQALVAPLVSATASSLAVTQAAHAGKIVLLNRAAGIAVTLPAATGTGSVYTFIVLATFTGAASIAVANATDYFIGTATNGIDGGTFAPHQYPTANTGTVATESDTLSMFGTANSTGGFKGQIVTIIDVATAIFFIRSVSDAAGTEANPFSAAV